MPAYNKIAITTGDKNGIGFEITAKALCQLAKSNSWPAKTVFFVYRDKNQDRIQKKLFSLLDKKCLRYTFSSIDAAEFFLNSTKLSSEKLVIDLSLHESEGFWVKSAAQLCKEGYFSALVTGPISKKKTVSLPGKPVGHTGILQQLFPKNKLFMGFIGKHFNVLLATDHISLTDVEKNLDLAGWLDDALAASKKFRQLLGSRKKIAVLGLNPHAGEGGLLGKFEARRLKIMTHDFVGPLVPDAAFSEKGWSRYSLYLCMYHDQGLIPFKLIHKKSGVHVTVGLPFIRTSVDHGTAFDIFNKNLADPSSMLAAIKYSLRTARK